MYSGFDRDLLLDEVPGRATEMPPSGTCPDLFRGNRVKKGPGVTKQRPMILVVSTVQSFGGPLRLAVAIPKHLRGGSKYSVQSGHQFAHAERFAQEYLGETARCVQLSQHAGLTCAGQNDARF